MSPTGDLLVTMIFLWGGVLPSLLGSPSRVASASHRAASSTPFLGNLESVAVPREMQDVLVLQVALGHKAQVLLPYRPQNRAGPR